MRYRTALLSATIIAGSVGLAFADTASLAANVSVPTTTVAVSPFYDLFASYIVPPIVGILGVISGWVLKRAGSALHVTIESKYQASLQSALTTGLNLAVSKGHDFTANMHVDVRSELIVEVVEWVRQSVPDALRYLKVTPDSLAKLAEAKINGALGLTTTPVVVDTTKTNA